MKKPTEQEAFEYLERVKTQMAEGGAGLSAEERRLAKRYVAAAQRLDALGSDIQLLGQQIEQAQAVLRSKQTNQSFELGKSAELAEQLLEFKFPAEDTSPKAVLAQPTEQEPVETPPAINDQAA